VICEGFWAQLGSPWLEHRKCFSFLQSFLQRLRTLESEETLIFMQGTIFH
jgi:hypothetical protein